MAIKIGNVTLPDIPEEVKSKYPYLAISKVAMNYDDTLNKVEYMLFGSTVNIVHIPKLISKKSYDGIVTSEPTLCRYKFIPEETSSWTFEERTDRYHQLHNIINEKYTKANVIWTNHNINSATYYKDNPSGDELNDSVSYYDSMQFTVGTNVYFTKSIKFDGAWFQGIPVDILETYPYAIIQKVTYSSGEYGYVFRAANSPYIHVGRDIIDGSTDNIALSVMGDNETTALVSPDSNKNTYYSYDEDTNTWGKLIDSIVITPVPIGNTIGDSGENLGYYELVWANHDIHEATSYNNNTKEYTIGEEIYFEYSYLINSIDSHYKAIASKVREILGNDTTYKPRELPDAIRSTSNALNPYNITNGVVYRESGEDIIGSVLYPGAYMNNCPEIIVLQKHITEIKSQGLYLAFGAKKIVFNEGLTTIGQAACYNLYKLEEIELPESLISIGFMSFDGCRSLTSITIPKNVTTIEYSAFGYCNKCTEVTILSDQIEELDKTFQGCTALKYVDIKGNVTRINDYTFYNNTALETLILRGNSCSNLANKRAFTNTPIASGTGYIYVPTSLIDTYKTKTQWSAYANQFRAIEDYPEICDPTE